MAVATAAVSADAALRRAGRLLGGRRQYDDGVAMLTSMEERQEEVPPSASEAAAESNADGYVRVVKADGSTAWVKVRDLAMT